MTDIPFEAGEIWQISFELADRTGVEAFEAVLEDVVTGVSSFEIVGTPGWRITVYTAGEPDHADILARLGTAAATSNVAMPDIDVSPVEAREWVAEAERALAPIEVGPFYVYGSHVTDAPPNGAIPIRIDAGQAFGTGNHETTKGCLQAIEAICQRQEPANPLDVGTGSGILAIALAKRLDIRVTASDNDAIAVDVASENAELNGVGGLVDFHLADGLGLAAIQAKAPYDLIVANIVANPLIAMSDAIGSALADSGQVVLSGILLDQSEDVVAAYQASGLGLLSRDEIGDWVTLTLGRR